MTGKMEAEPQTDVFEEGLDDFRSFVEDDVDVDHLLDRDEPLPDERYL